MYFFMFASCEPLSYRFWKSKEFVMSLFLLQLVDCEAELHEIPREKEERFFTYSLVPGKKSKTMHKGDELYIKFIAKTYEGAAARLRIPYTATLHQPNRYVE